MNTEAPQGQPGGAGPIPDPGAMAASLAPDLPAAAPRRRKAARAAPRRRRRGSVLWLMLSLALIGGAVGLAGLALTGAALRLPVWAVSEAEARINRMLAGPGGLPGTTVALDAVAIAVDRDVVPRIAISGVTVFDGTGHVRARLSELRLGVDPAALVLGRVRPTTLRVQGAQMTLVRLEDGRFDLALGSAGALPARSLSEILDRIEAIVARPLLSRLDRVEMQGMTLTLDDRRAGRLWEMGDGLLSFENRRDDIALRLGVSLVAGGAAPARADLTAVSLKATSEARLSVAVDGVAAADLAAQAPALGWLAVLDAPISGRLSGSLGADGAPGPVQGGLDIGAGALQPTPETRPIRFDRAGLAFTVDPVAGRIQFSDLAIDGPSLRLAARGQMMAARMEAGLPAGFLAQVRISDLQVDPAGLFEEPVRFSEGAIDLRLALDPFRIDIGQVALREDGRRLLARGHASATAKGWTLALDLSLNEISHDRLLALWPVGLVTGTRRWLADNVQQGLLFDVQAGLRLAPGAEPRLSLGYEFAGTDVRVVRSLPPVRDGVGHATLSDNSYVLVLDAGSITPPAGGTVDVAGSVFRVGDIRDRPATADLVLNTRSSVTAALSLLDEPPFRFLTRAGREVELAEGRAVTRTTLRLPLKPRLKPGDVQYSVFGTLYDLSSDRLVPGRRLTARQLALTADPAGLSVSGPGRLGLAEFDAAYRLPFGPEAGPPATVTGTLRLSPEVLTEFGIALPPGSLDGQGEATLAIDLPRGGPGSFALGSDLDGLTLRIAALGWTKPAATTGRLEVGGRFGAPPVVDRLALTAAGLAAEGSVALRPDGGLDLARLTRLRLGDWLDVSADLRGRGAGRDPGIEVTGGRADLRGLRPSGGGTGSGGGPLSLALDRLAISDGIALTAFRGRFTPEAAGLTGAFTARVNGGPLVEGSTSPAGAGTAVRLRSGDAGGVFEAAGIFGSARGGALDLSLTPAGAEGVYDGRVAARDLVVVDMPALAELLSLISVVGLLDQMNSDGLVFSAADAEFRLTPERVEIRRGAAVGASLGVSMEGAYDLASRTIRLQGVISPIYLLNGIGSLFTRPGEGVFGFNYEITGTSDRPQISVNPLSILTPGMFRQIFRQPLPAAGTGP